MMAHSMTFAATALPFESLSGDFRVAGLLVSLLVGFGFGFVLERAGFGRSTKLAAQFYGTDMTVFKVMFGAIVTAMLGVTIATGLGLVDLSALAATAISETYLWPMIVGGFLLGVGFITSGYCPGTSVVATASGNLDGLAAIAGVVVGSVVYGEIQPSVAELHTSGYLGQSFLHDWLGIPLPVLAVLVTGMAIGMFLGAEKVERFFSARRGLPAPVSTEPGERPRRRLAFATMGAAAVVAIATLAVPPQPQTAEERSPEVLAQVDLARRVLDEPWTLRILDVRSQDACAAQRIPGSECRPSDVLPNLGLADATGAQDLVVVSADGVLADDVKALVAPWRGRLLVAEGGFEGWKALALEPPAPLTAAATRDERAAYGFRAALNGAMTGRKAPPPPPAPTKGAAPKKKKGGGCG